MPGPSLDPSPTGDRVAELFRSLMSMTSLLKFQSEN